MAVNARRTVIPYYHGDTEAFKFTSVFIFYTISSFSLTLKPSLMIMSSRLPVLSHS